MIGETCVQRGIPEFWHVTGDAQLDPDEACRRRFSVILLRSGREVTLEAIGIIRCRI